MTRPVTAFIRRSTFPAAPSIAAAGFGTGIGIRIAPADAGGNGNFLDDFGKLLHETWIMKKSLSTKVSNGYIDDVYKTALNAGALGGKILGAGGGGFILFYVKPEYKESIKKALDKLLYVPFRFDTLGSQVIYYSEESV